ncbi:MAG TPA: TetR/AcrR family transcriptional regulator [Candidatus Binataceae bacterium]
MRKVDQAKYDEKRRLILNAAQRCFRRDGFRGASISDICAAARISPGHLYHYFDSKEAIIEALFELRLKQEVATLGELTLTPDADLVTALCGWLEGRVKDVRAHGSSLGLEMRAESARNPTIAKIASRADRGVRELLSRLLRNGQERGQVDLGLDPDIVAAVVASIIFGLNRLGAVRDPTFDKKAASDMLKLLIERFLRPQGIVAGNQVRHPECAENARKIPP